MSQAPYQPQPQHVPPQTQQAPLMQPGYGQPAKAPFKGLSPAVCVMIGCVNAAIGAALPMLGPAPELYTPYSEADAQSARIIFILLEAGSGVLWIIALAFAIYGSLRWAIFGKNCYDALPVSGGAGSVEPLLQQISERLLLSDTAKRIAYRQQDLEVLRRAIRQQIERTDYAAAMVLVQELSQAFGYREEAEHFREEIESARAQEMEAKISAAIHNFEQILERGAFDQAVLEAAKLQRLYPESPRVDNLFDRIGQGRERYKQNLERAFLEAAENNPDRAMELLKELDEYLTPDEAAPFQEVARGVISKQRDNLGVTFKLAIQDHDWLRAVHTGEQIITNFPNSRMATEVREMIDVLRQRAAQQQAMVEQQR